MLAELLLQQPMSQTTVIQEHPISDCTHSKMLQVNSSYILASLLVHSSTHRNKMPCYLQKYSNITLPFDRFYWNLWFSDDSNFLEEDCYLLWESGMKHKVLSSVTISQ
jgi:hypothetical protein